MSRVRQSAEPPSAAICRGSRRPARPSGAVGSCSPRLADQADQCGGDTVTLRRHRPAGARADLCCAVLSCAVRVRSCASRRRASHHSRHQGYVRRRVAAAPRRWRRPARATALILIRRPATLPRRLSVSPTLSPAGAVSRGFLALSPSADVRSSPAATTSTVRQRHISIPSEAHHASAAARQRRPDSGDRGRAGRLRGEPCRSESWPRSVSAR